MDKDIARRLLPLVNKQELYGDFIAYVDHRISILTSELVSANDDILVRRLQGSIKELQNIRNLKERVHGELNGK